MVSATQEGREGVANVVIAIIFPLFMCVVSFLVVVICCYTATEQLLRRVVIVETQMCEGGVVFVDAGAYTHGELLVRVVMVVVKVAVVIGTDC